MDFTAIDFETANGHPTSACSIGIALVENNKVMDVKHYLIRPYPDYFHPFNVRIHGITNKHVAHAPAFAELWPRIRPYFDGRIVAAHFAPFDMGVLIRTLDYYGLEKPEMTILCSCRLSRAAYPSLASHGLGQVCSFLGIPLEHHRADSDAEGSARIICRILEESGLGGLEDIRERFSLAPGFIKDGVYKPCRAVGAGTPKGPAPCAAVRPTPGFIDRDFVFSGTLRSMTRQKAFEVVSKGGGHPQNAVTQSTDYLVVGSRDCKKRGAEPGSKMRSAMRLREKGFPVRILAEDDFIGMITDELFQACFGEKSRPQSEPYQKE